MAQTYKVQKGDTLGAISKKLGVGMDTITGYKSGNVDKIYEGETLSYGAPATKKETPYVSEVKSQLTQDDNTSTDPYGLGSIRTGITDATTKRDTAFAELKDVSTKTFEDEYAKKGLAEKKARMSTLDAEITEAKRIRDEAINKVRTNPGLSAAQMTGDVNKLAEFQNNIINTKIAERNAAAGEYNTGLEEVDKVVSNKVKDKTLEYGYYDSIVKDLGGKVGDYTKAYREDLQDKTRNDQFDRQLAQALQIANIKAADGGSGGGSNVNLQLVDDKFTGAPAGTFNPRTGAFTPYATAPKATSIEDQLKDTYNTATLQTMAREAGYLKGGLFGFGKSGDTAAYIAAIKAGKEPSPIQ